MGFFDFLRAPGMDRGVETFRATEGAVLLDVRTPEEYRTGHVPGSKNLPLQAIGGADDLLAHKQVPLFVYCQSGARSRRAAEALRSMGYTNVTNIGGIAAYTGKVER